MNLVVVQHLLEDTEYFLKRISQFGFRSITVLGIGYSSRASIAERLERSGIRVILPDSPNLKQQVEKVLRNLLRRCRTRGERLLIHEIGGICGAILARWPKLSERFCIGAVEDTTFGLRVYESIRDLLRFTVYHVADSRLKGLEVRHVGESVANEIQSSLSLLGEKLVGLKCGVIGYGAVGSAVADALRRRLALVSVYDIDPVMMASAAMSGFVVHSREQFLSDVQLLIGATGVTSLQPADLDALPTGVILCSASSSNVEFPIDHIWQSAKYSEQVNERITRIELSNGRSIFILADGYPVNFLGNSVPDEVIDLVFAEIYLCLHDLLTNERPSGLYRIPPNLEHLAAQRWCEMQSAASQHYLAPSGFD